MKIKVDQFTGGTKVIDLEPGATKGATVGVDLFYNGVVVRWEDIYNGPPDSTGDVSVSAWSLLLDIPPNVVALANTATTGLYTITGAGTSATRTIQGTAGRTSVTNGNGVSGDPTLDLATLTDSGIGAALVRITRDAWGRVSGTQAAILGDLSDVDLTTTPPVSGDALVFDGADWVPGGGGGSGVLPLVTGEVPPVFVYADDGSLIYAPASY